MQGRGNGRRQREEGHIRHAEGEMEIKRQERGGSAGFSRKARVKDQNDKEKGGGLNRASVM